MIRSAPRAVAALFVVSALRLAPPASAQDVVDGVVATIDGKPITLSDVTFEAEVRALAAALGNPAALGRTLTAPTALDGILVRQALLRQAPPRESAADREIARDRARRLLDASGRGEGGAFLGRWGLTEEALVDWFKDLVRADAEGETRMEAPRKPSQAELHARWEAHPTLRAAPFEDARPVLEAEVLRSRFDVAWNAVVADALARSDIRGTTFGDALAPR